MVPSHILLSYALHVQCIQYCAKDLMQSSSSLWCCKNIIFFPCKTGLSLDSFIDSFKLGTNYVFFFDRLLLETQQWFIPWPSCLFYASAIHRSVLSDLAPQQTQTVPLKMVRYKKKERKKESRAPWTKVQNTETRFETFALYIKQCWKVFSAYIMLMYCLKAIPD